MHLSALAVGRPVGTTMLTLAAVLLGTISLTRLEVELLPEIRTESVTVWIAYPDAAVPEIEEAVARPAEEALAPVRGVRSLRSEVVSGGVSIRVRLHRGVDPELAALAVRERLDALRWSLPEGVERPRVSAGGADRAALVLALAASDLEAASDWATSVLRPRLEQVKGVARAEILGAPRPEVRITPDPVRMKLSGVTARELEAALQESNLGAVGGVLSRRGTRFAVEVEAGLTTAEEVGAVVVTRRAERSVRVSDLAEVEETWAPRQGWSRLDGAAAVGVLVHPDAESNLVRMAKGVRAVVAELNGSEEGFTASIVEDPSPFVEQAISGVWQAAWVGGLLAFLVLRLFLREWRSPILLLTALPASVIASFAIFEIADVSLNVMSLGGIALGVGMLVDSGILCLENIHRLRAQGIPAARAAAEGAREISLPMFASILTTCAVFVPLAFVPGPLGALFRDQAIAVSASLGVSLLTALTLLPMLASRWEGRVTTTVSTPFFGPFHRGLHFCLRHAGLTMLVTAVLLGVSVASLAGRHREMLPEVSSTALLLDLSLPLGTDVEVTGEAAQRIEEWLRSRPEVAQVFANVGASGVFDPAEARRRLARASIHARLHPQATKSRAAVVESLRLAFADRGDWSIEVRPSHGELGALLPDQESTLSCEIAGPDPATAERLAAELQTAAMRSLDPSLPPLRLRRAEVEPRFALTLRDDIAWRYGLDEPALLREVEARTSGFEATRLRRFDEEVPVMVRPAAPGHPGAATLQSAGRSYPLRSLFQTRTELTPASLLRADQARVAAIHWDGPMRKVRSVEQALEAAIGSMAWPTGYTVRIGGGVQEMRDSLAAILTALLLSAGLVLLVLAAQFESVRLPLLIFVAVPLSLIGVAAALAVTGQSLSVLAGVGLVVLTGIVVNDAILKVDLIRSLRLRGYGSTRAVLVASRQRYRPIIMTTATTVLALLPLYWGAGAELRAPLATTIIGGLSASTVLTLLVIPALYILLTRRPRRTAA